MARPNPDRRKADRQRSLLGARISTALHMSETECVVRDMGPDGMRIALSDAVPLPETFDLHIVKTRKTQAVRMVWRSGDHVGIRFLRVPPTPAPIPLDLMRDLRAARQEIVALRARLSQQEQEA